MKFGVFCFFENSIDVMSSPEAPFSYKLNFDTLDSWKVNN